MLTTNRTRAGLLAITGTAVLAAAAAAPAGAATEQVAGKGTRNAIGQLPASPSLPALPTIDATDNWIVGVAGPKGVTDDSKLTASSGALWFARLDDRPSRIEGLAGVPSWAEPHFGTDASGRNVVVYPRCAGGKVGDCDLYAWDVDANTERKLTEIDVDGTGEIEGTMRHGALAWTTSTDGAFASAAFEPSLSRVLRYRTAAGATSVRTRRGGLRLALQANGNIAQLHVGLSDFPAKVELITKDRRRTTLFSYGESAAPRTAVGLRFFSHELRFALASQDRDSAAIFRVPLSRPVGRQRVPAAAAFTSLAFARRDVLVWVGETTTETTAPLLSDFLPKRFG
jgi:hypothetical protein